MSMAWVEVEIGGDDDDDGGGGATGERRIGGRSLCLTFFPPY